jgi:phenylpropionate dioxygenase-like ring-hydroxylating dioxygenase large terminal subunit
MIAAESGRPARRNYPLDQWYAAAFSDEIGRTPLARTLLDRQVVLYRTSAGDPVALPDRCVHRKAPLSAGMLIGDAIECPFHGMQYAPDGSCLTIPCQDKIPRGANLRPYPVVDAGGHIWIWMGDPARVDFAAIPDTHWLIDPQLVAVKGSFLVRCNYLTALDNLLDDSHLSFVHRNSIGTAKIVAAPVVMQEEEEGVGFTRWTLDTPPSAVHAKAGGFTTNVDRWFTVRFVPPATVLIDVGSAPIGTGAPQGDRSKGIGLYSNGTLTPSAANSCHYFWHAARDFSLDSDEASTMLHKEMTRTFVEDVEIVEAVQRSLDCDAENLPQLDIAGDAAPLKARCIIDQLIAGEAQRHDSAA